MKTRISRRWQIATIAIAACLAVALAGLNAQQATEVTIGGNDLGGVVTSPNGPEAGVWVIAETTDLPTKFAKMVVTDDRGRYVIPDLPKATYNVWVRGYGLVDSPKVKATRGKHLNLTAAPAPTAAAAAEYYPGVYWYSMLQIPDKSEFPGTGPQRQRHRADDEDPALLDRHGQELVPILPCARLQGSPHDSQGMGTLRQFH